MKFFKSLPARLLLAIVLGILLGLVLPREAMIIVVTVKYILGQLISFCVPFSPMEVSGDHGEKIRCFSSSFPYSRTKRQRTASVWFVKS